LGQKFYQFALEIYATSHIESLREGRQLRAHGKSNSSSALRGASKKAPKNCPTDKILLNGQKNP
jgi:hypothetical protein